MGVNKVVGEVFVPKKGRVKGHCGAFTEWGTW